MAKLTGALTPLTTAWVQIANAGQTWMMSVFNGVVFVNWSVASPNAGDLGNRFVDGATFGVATDSQNAWVRADSTASIIVTKE